MINTNKKDILKNIISKVSLMDTGVKNNHDVCAPMKSSEEKVYYPSIYLSSKEAPMLIGTEAGSEVTMLIKAKVTSHSIQENSKEDKKENFNLEIHKIGVIETKNE